ncbi:MAG: hypothetical protein ACIARR_09435, partial [Phycisphaerales bacterium JB059]
LAAPVMADVEYEYREDDGVSSVTLGPPRSFEEFGDIDMLWGNYYFTNEPTERLTEVHFGLGSLSADATVHIWIFDDPDDDADPTNAVPLYNLSTTGANLGFDFNMLTIPDHVEVSGGFFVAVGPLAELTYPDGEPDYPSPPASIPTVAPTAPGSSTTTTSPRTTSPPPASSAAWTASSSPSRAPSPSAPTPSATPGATRRTSRRPSASSTSPTSSPSSAPSPPRTPAPTSPPPFGTYDFSDVVAFLGAFSAGCP